MDDSVGIDRSGKRITDTRTNKIIRNYEDWVFGYEELVRRRYESELIEVGYELIQPDDLSDAEDVLRFELAGSTMFKELDHGMENPRIPKGIGSVPNELEAGRLLLAAVFGALFETPCRVYVAPVNTDSCVFLDTEYEESTNYDVDERYGVLEPFFVLVTGEGQLFYEGEWLLGDLCVGAGDLRGVYERIAGRIKAWGNPGQIPDTQ